MAFLDTLMASDGDCRLGWIRDGSHGAFLLLQLLLTVGYVEKV